MGSERVFFLPQLLAREVKEQLEVARRHYIFNEASRLFSFAAAEQRAEHRTLTSGARLAFASRQQAASSWRGLRVQRCLEAACSAPAGSSLIARVTTGRLREVRIHRSAHVVCVTSAMHRGIGRFKMAG